MIPLAAAHETRRSPERSFGEVTGRKEKYGAGEGARTLDPDLGKVVLYH
jgi:hypothetical protein